MFDQLPQLPADPILGLTVACRDDNNPNKVDLGVGVFKNEAGDTPILGAVITAQNRYLQAEKSKAYLPPQGTGPFLEMVNHLIFGAQHRALQESRVATIQGTGGCGSLRVAAEVIKRANPNAKIWVSEPSWPNHASLLGNSGLELAHYPYYNRQSHELDFESMLAALGSAGPNDIVLLHACCHNPSGADLTKEQWRVVTDLAQRNGFIPFIDMAYQGFGQGLNDDAYGLRYMASHLPELIVANSFSKNFGLYRERVGSVSFMVNSAQQTEVVKGQMLNVARAIYSMPPAHGAALVEAILSNADLTTQWKQELESMRCRIVDLRKALVDAITATGCKRDFSFIARQQGMFSFLGLTKEQVTELKSSYSIYMTDSSRINICGLNTTNMEYVARAVADVVKG